MERIDHDKYSTEELRELLRHLVCCLTDERCREVLEELKN